MGNAHLFTCGMPNDPHGLLCTQACGIKEMESDLMGCDPAGVVFDDTVCHLSDLDQMTFKFAGSSNLAALRWLFIFGASHEACDTAGTSLLHVACRTGSLQTVKDLVRRGASVNAVDSAGWTALHVASCMGRQDVSLYLLESGAEAGARNGRGQTPEDVCSHPWTKEAVVTYKSQAKAKPARVGFPGRGPSDNVGYSPQRASDRAQSDLVVSLHFEPFFVPRDAILHEPRHREDLQRLGVHLFNKSPGHGLAFLVAAGAVRDYPVEINSFLVRVGADPGRLGEFLGADFSLSQTLRLEFLNSLPLLGTGVVSALETAFHEMAVPNDWVKADRLTRGVAHFWWRQHEEDAQESSNAEPGGSTANRAAQGTGERSELVGFELQKCLLGTDALHRLMFSALKLYQWLTLGKSMSVGEWTQLNTSIECNGNDVPMHVQTGIYKTLTEGRVGLRNCSSGDKSVTISSAPFCATARVEGWAYVQHTGNTQATLGGQWPDASPRLLAEEGGATAAGRSAPFPCVSTAPGLPDLPVVSTVVSGSDSTEPAGINAALQSVDIRSARDDSAGGELAWVGLYGWTLLLSSASSDTTPYAFVSLKQAVVKDSSPSAKRIVLANRSESSWSPLGASEDDWLDLCLLLGDGRFQALEAPLLDLRFTNENEYKSWSAQLGDVCGEEGRSADKSASASTGVSDNKLGIPVGPQQPSDDDPAE